MVSITVNEKFQDMDTNSYVGVGHQLSHLCIKHAIVGKGFLIWAMDKCRGADFALSAAYPTMAPSIMSFARIICKYHPLCRMSVVNLAFIFLNHSNPDLSYQKIQGLKEQALRLLLIACTQGLAIEILGYMSSKLHQSHGQSDLDSALFRYFIEGLLDIVQPPFSLPFVRSMGGLLSTKACVEALNSPYFTKKKESLIRIVDDMSKSIFIHASTTASDEALMNSLKTFYMKKG